MSLSTANQLPRRPTTWSRRTEPNGVFHLATASVLLPGARRIGTFAFHSITSETLPLHRCAVTPAGTGVASAAAQTSPRARARSTRRTTAVSDTDFRQPQTVPISCRSFPRAAAARFLGLRGRRRYEPSALAERRPHDPIGSAVAGCGRLAKSARKPLDGIRCRHEGRPAYRLSRLTAVLEDVVTPTGPLSPPVHGAQRDLARSAAGGPGRDGMAARRRASRRPRARRGGARHGPLHARARRRHGPVPRALLPRSADRPLCPSLRRLSAAPARHRDARHRPRALRTARRGQPCPRDRARDCAGLRRRSSPSPASAGSRRSSCRLVSPSTGDRPRPPRGHPDLDACATSPGDDVAARLAASAASARGRSASSRSGPR